MDFLRLWQIVFYGLGVLATSVAFGAQGRDPRPFVQPYHDGFVLVLWQDYTDAEVTAILQRARATGADMLEIPVLGCQSTITSSDVADCQPNNRDVAMKIGKAAVAQGFGVTFLPIVITPKWEWRGTFDPDDVAA